MPFRSKAQMRKLYATHPAMAKRWAKETPNMKSLPERVGKNGKKRKKGKRGRRYR